jgi:hypothetical protein
LLLIDSDAWQINPKPDQKRHGHRRPACPQGAARGGPLSGDYDLRTDSVTAYRFLGHLPGKARGKSQAV